jgi:hypothetical protein
MNMVEYIQIHSVLRSERVNQDINMDCSKHTGEIKCAHYYCAICKNCNKIICHTCLLEEELYDLNSERWAHRPEFLIYGDEFDYDVTCISDDDNVGNEDEMPPLEPWTPTKK